MSQPNALYLAQVLQTDGNSVSDAAAAELRRLHQHELANNLWHEKTEWVQETAYPEELGMHRADVLRQRIERLQELTAELLAALNKLASWNDGEVGRHMDEPYAAAISRAAIKKAEGKV